MRLPRRLAREAEDWSFWAISGGAPAPNNAAPRTEPPIRSRRVKEPSAPCVVAEPSFACELCTFFIAYLLFRKVGERDQTACDQSLPIRAGYLPKPTRSRKRSSLSLQLRRCQ